MTSQHAANPVFGHLAPPGSTEDTIEQEVLNLFTEPEPEPEPVPKPTPKPTPRASAPPPPTAASPFPGRRRGKGKARARVLLCGAAVGIGSVIVHQVLPGDDDSRHPTAVERPVTPPAVPPPAETTRAPAPDPTPSASASATPTRQVTRPSSRAPRPSRTPSVDPTPSATPSSTPPPAPPPPPSREPEAIVLSLGSRGPQVSELQQRLWQLEVYDGPVDGVFSTDVTIAVYHFQWLRNVDESPGVYGPATRAALEAETGAGAADADAWS